MMNIAYVRVSTKEQNTGRQLEALKAYEIGKIYEEKISGKDTNRPELQAMLEFAREGDIVYIESISRLARHTLDFLNIVEQLNAKNVFWRRYKKSSQTERHLFDYFFIFYMINSNSYFSPTGFASRRR